MDTLQCLQDTMKAANKVCRSTKLSEVEKVDELVALGIKEHDAVMLLHPTQSWQSVGFATYQLQNNLAKIKATQAAIDRHGSHGKDEEKAMRSMGPPHAYVCGLLIKLLHYQIFLKSPCPD